MPKLLIATKNKGKLIEIQNLLENIPHQLVDLGDAGITDDIPETGATFEENAIQKARFAGLKSGLLTLADDSGLEIEYLEGRPGVKSARYVPGTDNDRVNQVLKELKGVPTEKRNAKFVAVVALFDPRDNSVKTWRGESLGTIADVPRGSRGFGYDPIFYNFDIRKTNAQATAREKNQVSHRARALRQARIFLE
ncbi:MAG: RdgB/HAM1 family non-canonical purine NTP pyrophosphatase, dITP/XTP pyrophosphatase [Candidatus Gottesmanbacteria bacterium GW2011_GWA2_43_14]|uniref:dITP/XTP pyrophosphatase n=1 Tax=Candidatus Gottesmanbacteria bacterium GW2011_GWA2_43_14 TaxID=1618443 RepID=A0A0G1GB15_9BACT|nr:MAG: RdgB/HAM1 family non-canonical purine NTP pyrophosphatase, dITP/XTP pyrophosphatase [Candidatus Gottesmanbacteria bacterium GW2011_GWA2_43_14]